MPAVHSDELATHARARLAALGNARASQQQEANEMADQIRAEVLIAQRQQIPMTEIAQLLGIDRSTLYRTYV